jgi:hypothetical protein
MTKWIQFGSAIGLGVTTICAVFLMSKPFVDLGALASELPPSSRREYEDCIVEMIYMNSDRYRSPFA